MHCLMMARRDSAHALTKDDTTALNSQDQEEWDRRVALAAAQPRGRNFIGSEVNVILITDCEGKARNLMLCRVPAGSGAWHHAGGGGRWPLSCVTFQREEEAVYWKGQGHPSGGYIA
jgi:hypothetical protein